MMRYALIAVYLGAIVLSIALVDADTENNWLALAIWAIASLVLGWILARWELALLPLLAIPIALPFGHANRWLGSDSPPVWFFAVEAGAVAAILVLAATLARRRLTSRHGRSDVARRGLGRLR